MRGFMLDSARTLESRRCYERFIDFMADRGCDTLLWHFSDDQGCSLRFDALPEAASPNAYTKAELRGLIDHAKRRGVTVIPELETLGHTRYITHPQNGSRNHPRPDLAELSENNATFTSLCPVHPRTREIVGTLLDEVCELFDAPLVHVGLDEVNFGDHPLTKAALRERTPGQLFADHIQFLHQRLAARGKRLMMWGDHLLKDATIAEAIPRDILIANWQYNPQVPTKTTRRLRGWGFEVVACPALISYSQPLFPGERYAVPNLRNTAAHVAEGDTLGTITTIWTPQRYLHDALWPGVHLAADFMRHGPGVAVRDSMRGFAESFHGLTPSDRWLDAMATLFERSPLRKHWIAVLKLDVGEALAGIDLKAEARVWPEVHEALAAERERVQREAGSYDTLVLMSELLAHAWDRAARAQAGELDEQTLRRSEAIAERLSAAWDRERFADDPRKHTPVFPFDADQHLLVAFAQGTAAMK